MYVLGQKRTGIQGQPLIEVYNSGERPWPLWTSREKAQSIQVQAGRKEVGM